MRPVYSSVLVFIASAAVSFCNGQQAIGTPDKNDHWVGTWTAAPQLTETKNLPPPPGLTSNTLRQIVHVSIGGRRLRVRFSNTFGNSPVTMNSVHVAASTGGNTIEPQSDRSLTFHGESSATISPGQEILSDDFNYDLSPLSDLAVTIYFAETSPDITGHPGSRTTSYLQAGNSVSATNLPAAVTTQHWYILTGIDILSDTSSAAIVALGDSITDGLGSKTGANNRWPDNLARRLHTNAPTANIAVLNQGIGGNTVLTGGLGPTALARFDRDVLGQNGVRWLIVLEGVNDIGGSRTQAVATNLIAAYEQLIDKAHARSLHVYGVPILPFGRSMYSSADHETSRQTVNNWIRTSGKFDAVIDLDAAVCNPTNSANLLPAYDTGDHLHLNMAGYQRMADAIDLTLFKLSKSEPEKTDSK